MNVQRREDDTDDDVVIQLTPKAMALARVRRMRAQLRGDVVLLPVTDEGRLDVERLRDEDGAIDYFYGQARDLADGDEHRLGVLVDGFMRFLPDAPPGTSVVVLDRGGTPEVVQFHGFEPCEAAVDLVAQAISDHTDLIDTRRPGEPFSVVVDRLNTKLGTLKEQFAEVLEAKADAPVPAAKSQPRARFTLTWFGEIADAVPKETFVKGVLGDGEFTVVSGLPGSGKSVILTDLACHVAAGMEWMGRRVRQGLVVYIAAERKALTERRMVAFRKRHGVPAHVPLLVLGGRIDLTSNTSDANALVRVIRDAAKEVGLPAVWVIIDTLTRTFGAGDQNLSKDMTRFIQSIDVLLETKAHVTVVHHTAWSGERGKGAIDLDGAVDASFLVKKDGGSHVLICDGTNDGEEGAVCRFRMESVQVGTDEDGEPTTAPVVVPAEDLAENLVARVKGHNAKALEILTEACREGTKLAEDEWRAAFYAAYPGDKQHALKMRFQRARRALVEAGAVYHHDGEYWVPVDGTHGTCAANVPCAV